MFSADNIYHPNHPKFPNMQSPTIPTKLTKKMENRWSCSNAKIIKKSHVSLLFWKQLPTCVTNCWGNPSQNPQTLQIRKQVVRKREAYGPKWHRVTKQHHRWLRHFPTLVKVNQSGKVEESWIKDIALIPWKSTPPHPCRCLPLQKPSNDT